MFSWKFNWDPQSWVLTEWTLLIKGFTFIQYKHLYKQIWVHTTWILNSNGVLSWQMLALCGHFVGGNWSTLSYTTTVYHGDRTLVAALRSESATRISIYKYLIKYNVTNCKFDFYTAWKYFHCDIIFWKLWLRCSWENLFLEITSPRYTKTEAPQWSQGPWLEWTGIRIT